MIHADPHLLVVDKPPGVVVHPGAGRRRGTLAAGLLAAYPELATGRRAGSVRAGPPSRCRHLGRADRRPNRRCPPGPDRCVAAAGDPADLPRTGQRRAQRIPRARSMHRSSATSGHPDSPARSGPEVNRPGRTIGWRRRGPMSLCSRSSSETGRTHQIRVHLAAIGHPVAGDRTYGIASPEGRMFLHAWKISLAHPVTSEHLEFTAPLPTDLATGWRTWVLHTAAPFRTADLYPLPIPTTHYAAARQRHPQPKNVAATS